MKLSALLEGVQVTKMFQLVYGRMVVTQDIDIQKIEYDSRKVGPRDCFVAIHGTGTDGHNFVGAAIERGASVVVLENDGVLPDSYFMHAGTAKIVVPDSRKALAILSANYYGHPSKAMKLVGVTGTNGKTTTTHLVRSIFEAAGVKTGLIGTIEYRVGDTVIPATHTTPESLELNALFADMRRQGCTAVSMEVSSHALHQSRAYGLAFDAGVFTNLTQDHLDYHGTMDAYLQAKKILFDSLASSAYAVTNIDDPNGSAIVGTTHAARLTYSATKQADVRAEKIDLRIEGTRFTAVHDNESTTISSPLVGRFNVYNMLAAFSAGIALGIPKETIRKGIERIQSVRGRFERISSPDGWTVIVDYAHTPDALEKCLLTIHDVLPSKNRGKIITVFGAGGDRDKAKRPLMGAVAGKLSDTIVVTSDNPRTEDPASILDDIIKGLPNDSRFIR
ncbi:MAG TPA: UDP-N-acetylmuramoyl-L-alanyl-D-glutamate--2,6-diaminopimelate ligase, partial [Bacteroidota bacterium]|nr:UDP-N-acetylmuramoyl-L-alanyl-D-glutamate--2,6-diaminopimelate ligase [Bacteroidota bacterium]